MFLDGENVYVESKNWRLDANVHHKTQTKLLYSKRIWQSEDI